MKVRYSKELLEESVKDCYSFSELCRKLGLVPKGSNPRHVKLKLDEYQIDYSHFTGQNWNSNSKNPVYIRKYSKSLDINSSLSSSHVKSLLFKMGLKKNVCECCGLSEWNGLPLQCELHHINGDPTDNRIKNLIILCPNCHSQTDNFRNKRGKSAHKEIYDVEAG